MMLIVYDLMLSLLQVCLTGITANVISDSPILLKLECFAKSTTLQLLYHTSKQWVLVDYHIFICNFNSSSTQEAMIENHG